MDRPLEALEEIFVVHDVAVFLVIPIQAVHAADGLKQPVIAHLLVDVEIGGRWRVKAGQELVHNDQELHLSRLFHELLFDLFLKRFGVFAAEHLIVNVVLLQLLGQSFAGFLALDIGRRRLVRRNDGAPVKPLRGE